jgi:hypothetical protein
VFFLSPHTLTTTIKHGEITMIKLGETMTRNGKIMTGNGAITAMIGNGEKITRVHGKSGSNGMSTTETMITTDNR